MVDEERIVCLQIESERGENKPPSQEHKSE